MEYKLSKKETMLVEMIGNGMTNSEIAVGLGITKASVGVYIHNLCRIVGARNRIELFNKLKKSI